MSSEDELENTDSTSVEGDSEPIEEVVKGHNRQPIVSVLGHVDHGKTSLLDLVRSIGSQRQASVMDREAGGITQHIGATEVPAEVLNDTCKAMMGGREFKSPGLLFIDTPGHSSFSALRDRGGALADIAVVVVDVMEGLQPQTIESLEILKRTRTPFIVVGNKVDRIHGWLTERGRSFAESYRSQRQDVRDLFETRYWKLVGQFSEYGFNLERYDQIKNFKQNVALVPMSAKEGEGLQDALVVLVGLAERFLEDRLTDTIGPAEGTILEMKDEVGMSKTIDVILYKGVLNKGDKLVLAGVDGPFGIKIKGLKRPKGMAEMRDAGDRWESVDSVEAACGVKILATGLDRALAGTTIRLFEEHRFKELKKLAREEARVDIKIEEEGVVIKADTIGGLEALAYELGKLEIPISNASIGPINKKDILLAECAKDPLNQIIIGFATKPNVEVAPRFESETPPVKLVTGEIIYHIIETVEQWREETHREIEAAKRENLVHPGRLLYLRDHTFRGRNPAIVGVRVVGGRVHIGQRLMKIDGTPVGQVKSLRTREGEDVKEAHQGDEVACAITGPTVGRHIDEGDEFYVDVPESHVRRLRKVELSEVEKDILDQIITLHRKEDHFWGR